MYQLKIQQRRLQQKSVELIVRNKFDFGMAGGTCWKLLGEIGCVEFLAAFQPFSMALL